MRPVLGESALIKLCNVSDVEADVLAWANIGGQSYAVFKVERQYYVAQDLCTHEPGTLSDGYVDGREVERPFQWGRFDICTGRPTHAPCTVKLRTRTVGMRDGP
jgi:nitrite reductase/ring-hydroxylating ferredoxin subunit